MPEKRTSTTQICVKTDTHLLVRLTFAPGCLDEYLGLCGAKGTDKKRYSDKLPKVTCPECLKRAGVKGIQNETTKQRAGKMRSLRTTYHDHADLYS